MATPSFKPILLDLLHQAKQGENIFVLELDPAELNITGTPDFWSAKDHIAHLAFWRRQLVKRLTAIVQHQEVQMDTVSYEQLNGKLGQICTGFEVKHRKSARKVGIDHS